MDPRLVALALGRIDDDELDELMERAVKEPGINRAVQAYWPLDEESHRLSFERAQRVLDSHRHAPKRPHLALMFLPTGMAASVVGLVAFIVVGLTSLPPLPAYDLEVRAGFRQVRSAQTASDVGRLTPNAPIELVFRPSKAVEGLASAALFHVGSRDIVRLDINPDVSASGSVRWRGTIQSLLPGVTGNAQLIIAVRSGARRPTVEEVRRALQRPSQTLKIARKQLFIDGQ